MKLVLLKLVLLIAAEVGCAALAAYIDYRIREKEKTRPYFFTGYVLGHCVVSLIFLLAGYLK